MIKKCLSITILLLALAGCDDDFRQGSCDDGFYQQSDGSGGYFCAPITEATGIDQPETTIKNELD